MQDIVYISDKLSETNFNKLLVILNKLNFNQVFINSNMLKKVNFMNMLLKHYQCSQILFVVCICEKDAKINDLHHTIKYHDMQLCYRHRSYSLNDIQFIKKSCPNVNVINFIGTHDDVTYKYNYVNNHFIQLSNNSDNNNNI